MSPAESREEAGEINGVVYRVSREEMPNFDRREVGYEKVKVPLDMLVFHPEISGTSEQTKFTFGPEDTVWLYVPLATHYADENHPLLQSYVDTVLQGCLEWGGEPMAESFIISTSGWGIFFLNDTPSSRRPWLFRKEYNVIDQLLKKYSDLTHYGDRRHPEEFASAFNQRMKGTWSIPRRNPNFTGRDHELEQLQSRLLAQDLGRRAVVRVEVAGMGGVGKSQLVTEYCYRHFPSEYGLVVWLNAETSDTLVADYRQLLADLAADTDVDDINKSTDDIIGEVKTRLFRSQVPWLLVFDNIEDHSLLDKFVPHGAGSKGHVLITTRHLDTVSAGEGSGNLILGCFDTSESLELLRRSAGDHNMEGEQNKAAATELCERLGNLPLALGMAAAYTRRCDVQISEYLDRYIMSEKSGQSMMHGKLNDYALTVASSLSLSLGEIEKESETSREVLQLLSFLAPDQHTKSLIRHLLSAKRNLDEHAMSRDASSTGLSKEVILSFSILLSGAYVFYLTSGRQKAGTLAILASVVAAASILVGPRGTKDEDAMLGNDQQLKRVTSASNSFSAFEYEQSDIAWNILKSYSLLSVKEGKGSVHRLLQQAMRYCQSKEEVRYHVAICIDAMYSMFTFNPLQTETWKESLQFLEHVKTVVPFALECGLDTFHTMRAGRLSKDAAIFSAMTLNQFIEAQASLDLSLKLYESTNLVNNRKLQEAKAEALHELGRVFRYQGNYADSEISLKDSLRISRGLNCKDETVKQCIADTLHELGVLEVKKHNLDVSECCMLRRLCDLLSVLTLV